jgi:hypothetical protein
MKLPDASRAVDASIRVKFEIFQEVGMDVRRATSLMTLVLLMGVISRAQAPDIQPGRPDAAVPVVTYEQNWAEASPRWYLISVASTGTASYQSQPHAEPNEVSGDPFKIEFTATEATRTKIFEMAKAVNHFQGEFEYKGNIAKTGSKTLVYKDGTKESRLTINYSSNSQLMQLISMFQNISNTMELGRKLAFQIRFDKLGVDATLKRMEEMNKQGLLLEMQAIEPVLKQIATDHSFMNIARQRAQRLLGLPVSPSGSR